MGRFMLVQTREQWQRAAHLGTALDPDRGEVSLGWKEEEPGRRAPAETVVSRQPLAFDSAGQMYQLASPQKLLRWRRPAAGALDRSEPVDLFAAADVHPGDFRPAEPSRQSPHLIDLVVDKEDHLVLAGAMGGRGRLWIFDLRTRWLLRELPLPLPPRALACHRTAIYCVVGEELYQLDARRRPRRLGPLAIAASDPVRLCAAPNGILYLLTERGSPQACITPLNRPDQALREPGATDIAFLDENTLVVARQPGEDFRCHSLLPDRYQQRPLRAWDYAGSGIARTPDGHIGYVAAGSLQTAFVAPARYPSCGYVISFRFDSGEHQMTWGRLFLHAHQPEGTELRVCCFSTDEAEGEPIAARPPLNQSLRDRQQPQSQDPPLPPRELLPEPLRSLAELPATSTWPADAADAGFHPLYCRANGSEHVFAGPDRDERIRTFEAQALGQSGQQVPPGRFLWVAVQLRSSGRRTPRLRSLSVEYPGHGLLRRLPRVFSREEHAADFMQRYLGLIAGPLSEWEERADNRHILLHPMGAPAAALPWLASLIGMPLDERFSESQKRRLLDAAAILQRERGTPRGLQRLLEIYTGGPVRLLEHHRLRGPAAIVGDDLGVGYGLPLSGPASADPCAPLAHRCTVVVSAQLAAEQRRVVEHLIAAYLPAHVRWQLQIAEGMRLGRSARVGVDAVLGGDARLQPLQLGETAIGSSTLWKPEWRTRLDHQRLGSAGGS